MPDDRTTTVLNSTSLNPARSPSTGVFTAAVTGANGRTCKIQLRFEFMVKSLKIITKNLKEPLNKTQPNSKHFRVKYY
jgi:hypothetical protein